jgi:hypothetical protein
VKPGFVPVLIWLPAAGAGVGFDEKQDSAREGGGLVPRPHRAEVPTLKGLIRFPFLSRRKMLK